jgi:uncharacterized integral membrane protein
MSRIIQLVFILLVLLAGIVFHLRNDQLVALDFYSGILELPFSVWILLALTVGAVLGLLACLPAMVSGRIQNARLRRRLLIYEPRDKQPPAALGGRG